MNLHEEHAYSVQSKYINNQNLKERKKKPLNWNYMKNTLIQFNLNKCITNKTRKKKMEKIKWELKEPEDYWNCTSRRFFGRNHGIDRKRIANRNWNRLWVQWDTVLLSSSPPAVVRGGGEGSEIRTRIALVRERSLSLSLSRKKGRGEEDFRERK